LPVLLTFLPSVVTTSDAGAGIGYTGIRIRGVSAQSTNITINGIPFNDPESHGTFGSIFQISHPLLKACKFKEV
jgi:iron complex outermembrane receptor protein